jgi:hypothetical protein
VISWYKDTAEKAQKYSIIQELQYPLVVALFLVLFSTGCIFRVKGKKNN